MFRQPAAPVPSVKKSSPSSHSGVPVARPLAAAQNSIDIAIMSLNDSLSASASSLPPSPEVNSVTPWVSSWPRTSSETGGPHVKWYELEDGCPVYPSPICTDSPFQFALQ